MALVLSFFFFCDDCMENFYYILQSTASNIFIVSAEENSLGHVVLLTIEKVLELIESAYPNPITVQDIAKYVLFVFYS